MVRTCMFVIVQRILHQSETSMHNRTTNRLSESKLIHMLRLSVSQDTDAHPAYPIRQSCSTGTARTLDKLKATIGFGPGTVAIVTCCSRMDCAGPGLFGARNGYGVWGN